MTNFEYNNLEDLVFSRSFRNWVLTEDSPEGGFWENWVARHPDQGEMVNHAKAIIYALQLGLRPLSEDEVDTEIRKVLFKLQDGRLNFPAEEMGLPSSRRRYKRAGQLAVILIGICLLAGVGEIYHYRHRKDVFRNWLASNDPVIRRKEGDSSGGRVLLLPDGTRVVLGAGSRLYYPDGFISASHRREVFLEGDGTFDVTRNVSFPFYVYTRHVITKVLGTTFRVKTSTDGQQTVVSVRSGKVSVYEAGEPDRAGGSGKSSMAGESGGIVVTPNQELVYDPGSNRLDKRLSPDPRRLPAVVDTSFVFAATSISTVFKRLQDLYGIPIVYDEETVKGCSLSAMMGNESFYEKLNIICKAIGATYEVIDGNIVISARGCNH